MEITLKGGFSSNLDALHATKAIFRGNGLNLDVLNASACLANGEGDYWWI